MDAVLTATALGLAVGLGIAIPLGAIGVLLLQTGMTSGWRTAAAGGLGAAAVDLAYAAAAVAAGTAVAGALAAHTRSVQLLGAAVLALVAARGVVGLVRTGRAPAPAADDGATASVGTTTPSRATTPAGAGAGALTVLDERRPRGPLAVVPARPAPGRTFARFVALTAVNPLTVVYFVAVAAGLGERLATPPAAVAFVVGIGLASAAWQLALAATGAVLGARVSPAVRTGLSVLGYAVVGGFALALALP